LNVCRGTVKQNSEGIWFDGGFQIKVTNGSAKANALNGLFVDGELTRDVTIGFRAEDVALADQEPAVSAIVEDVDCLGDSTLIHTRVCGQDDNLNDDLNHGHDSRHRIVARLAGDSNLVQGESVRLSVDLGKVLWFDLVSGENLLKERT
jgi:ABC-type sugar transport system ATPase subunit